MKRSNKISCFLVVFSLVCAIGGPQIVMADDGGAVQTKGVIGFYEASTESTSIEEPISSESSAPESTENSEEKAVVVKPKGKFPSTGELVKTGLSFSGVALVLGVLLFFFWKKRQEGGAKR